MFGRSPVRQNYFDLTDGVHFVLKVVTTNVFPVRNDLIQRYKQTKGTLWVWMRHKWPISDEIGPNGQTWPCDRSSHLTLCTLLNHKATKSLLISDAALIMRCLSVFVCLVKHRCHSASSLSCCHCYLWNHRCSHLPVKPFVCLTSVENCSVTFSVCYDCFVFKQFEHSGSLWRVSFCAFHIIILCNRSVCAGFLINLHIKESVWLWMTGCYGCLDFTHFTGLIMFGGIPS